MISAGADRLPSIDRLVQPDRGGADCSDRNQVRVDGGLRAADALHGGVPQHVGQVEREQRRQAGADPGAGADLPPLDREHVGDRVRQVEQRAERHRPAGDDDGRVAGQQRLRRDGVGRPRQHGAEGQDVAERARSSTSRRRGRRRSTSRRPTPRCRSSRRATAARGPSRRWSAPRPAAPGRRSARRWRPTSATCRSGRTAGRGTGRRARARPAGSTRAASAACGP